MRPENSEELSGFFCAVFYKATARNGGEDVGGVMAKYKLEYIWLDGYQPVPNLRSKTQIKEFASFPKLAELPIWGFDGSSTQQAEGKSSDCKLHPVAVFPDSTRKNGALVMCEVYMP